MDDRAALYLGMISGTSVDGIDVALASFEDERPTLHAGLTHPWPAPLRESILALAQSDSAVDLDALGRLDVAIGRCFACAAEHLIERCAADRARIRAIGTHGQTLRHRPGGEFPFTLQLGDASVIAERCGIDVVADFRRADIAAGGQGAPLLPAVHAMLFSDAERPRVVLNLGGIANITVLRPGGHVLGFDTGPANGLMDAWCLRHRGEPFDRDGGFAAGGHIDPPLLQALLRDPYFQQPPPKSTGREHFHLGWLGEHARVNELAPQDVQATLLELTIRSVTDAIVAHAEDALDILVCGGGVHHPLLMQRLAERLAPRTVQSTAAFGVDPDYLEATAFAWLARQRLLQRPGNLPRVTGARGARVLGAVFHAPLHTR